MRTVRNYAALLVLAAGFAALFSVLAPGASAATTTTHAGRYPHAACDLSGGAVNPDLTWVGHVVGCDTDVPQEVIDHLLVLRQAGCEGIRANVPASRIVAVFAAELGDRTEAVTLLTATSVWCYGG